jgi:hypothetical protein
VFSNFWNTGLWKKSKNQVILIDIICYRKLIEITNTFLIHKDIRKFAWCARNCTSIIDYILANKKTTTLMKDTRVYRRKDIHSEHFLVIAKLAMPEKWRKYTVYIQEG